MKAKTILKGGAFFLLFIAIFASFTHTFVPIYSNERYSVQSTVEEDFQALPEHSTDALIIGASTVMVSVYPEQLWADYGITAYNYAATQQEIVSMYYTLKYALRTQSPKVVILDARPLMKTYFLDNEDVFENSTRIKMDRMQLSKAKVLGALDFATQSDQQSFISYILPLFRYHSRWNDLSEKDFFIDTHTAGAGYAPYYLGARHIQRTVELKDPPSYEEGPLNESSKYANIDERCKDYYEKLIQFAHQNGTEVLMVMIPKGGSAWSLANANAVQRFCVEQDIPYINFNTKSMRDALSLDFQSDFYNTGHLNEAGGRKVTAYLGTYLQENFDISDKRGDPHYEVWEKSGQVYQEELTLAKNLLRAETEGFFELVHAEDTVEVAAEDNAYTYTIFTRDLIPGEIYQLNIDAIDTMEGIAEGASVRLYDMKQKKVLQANSFLSNHNQRQSWLFYIPVNSDPSSLSLLFYAGEAGNTQNNTLLYTGCILSSLVLE